MKPESPDLLRLRELAELEPEPPYNAYPFDRLSNINWDSKNSRENVAWAIVSRLVDNYEDKCEWTDGINEFELVIDLIAKAITDSNLYEQIIAHCLDNGVIEDDYFED